jgi:hypothetical protein
MRHEQAQLQHLDEEYEGEGEDAGQGGDDQADDYGQGGDYGQGDGGDGLGGGSYYALCDANHQWAGPTRSSYEDAQADADHHNSSSHHGERYATVVSGA